MSDPARGGSEASRKISYLGRRLTEADNLISRLQDENAILLRRALSAESRIRDHYERKNNPDETDRRLWDGQ
jgi:hypothetical protein